MEYDLQLFNVHRQPVVDIIIVMLILLTPQSLLVLLTLRDLMFGTYLNGRIRTTGHIMVKQLKIDIVIQQETKGSWLELTVFKK